MKFPYYIGFTLACFSIFFNANVAISKTLTWQDCIKEIWQENPQLKASEHDLTASKHNVMEAYSGFLPDVSLTANIDRFNDSARGSPAIANNENYGGRAALEFFNGFETFAKVEVANAVREREGAELSQTKVTLLSDLRRRFAEMLFAQENIKLSDKIEKRLKRNADFLKLRYQGGLEARWVYLKGDADWKEAKWNVRSSDRDLQIAQQKLAETLGRNKFEGLKVSGNFNVKDVPSYREMLKGAMKDHPDIRVDRQDRAEAKAIVRQTKSAFWPTAVLFAKHNMIQISKADSRKVSSFGLEISFPIFSGFETLSATREANEIYLRESQTLRQTKLGVIKGLKESYDNYKSAIERVNVDLDLLKASEERAQVVQQEYTSGLKQFLDWEQAQDILTNAQKKYLISRREAIIELSRLEKAQGKELPSL